METQHNLARVLREVEAGEEVVITRRRKIVARILPPANAEAPAFPDFASRARDLWGNGWAGKSSDALLDEARGEK